MYLQQIQVRNIKLLVPRKLHKLHNTSCKWEGLQVLIHRVALSHQCPVFQAVGNRVFVHCACTVLTPFRFSLPCPPGRVALPCSPRACVGGSRGPNRPADPTGPQSPPRPTRLLLPTGTPWLGLCSSPGRSDSKTPFQPLPTTPWKRFHTHSVFKLTLILP